MLGGLFKQDIYALLVLVQMFQNLDSCSVFAVWVKCNFMCKCYSKLQCVFFINTDTVIFFINTFLLSQFNVPRKQ